VPAPIQPGAQTGEYDSGAKSLHWTTVVLLGAQFTIGWIMPGVHKLTQPGVLVRLHFSLGVLILGITAARLLWRLAVGVPDPPANLPRWQQLASQTLHTILYVLLFALVFSGWVYASSHGIAVTFFGLATLPAIFPDGSAVGQAIGNLHSPLAYVLLTAVGLHIGAALAHTLIWRDSVMGRMLPRLR
jgi:cytochrome b561